MCGLRLLLGLFLELEQSLVVSSDGFFPAKHSDQIARLFDVYHGDLVQNQRGEPFQYGVEIVVG